MKYLKALQEHPSSQLACLLSRGPDYGHRPFCGLTKWSRFGSKCIHKEEAQLHQPLGHMIPTEHTAHRKSRIHVKKINYERCAHDRCEMRMLCVFPL